MTAETAGDRPAILALGLDREMEAMLEARGLPASAGARWEEAAAALGSVRPELVIAGSASLRERKDWADLLFLHPEIPWVAIGAASPADLPAGDLLADCIPLPLDEGGVARLRTAWRLGRAQRLVNRLRRAESKLDLILANAPDVIYSLDAEGAFLSISHSVEALLGYSPAELAGKSVFPLIHPGDREEVARGFRRSLEGLEPSEKTLEFRLVGKDGSIRHCEVNRKLIYENGRFVESHGIARDLTRLRRAEDQLRAIVTASPIPLVVSRFSDGRVLFANESMARICGTTAGEMVGRNMPEFYWDPSERAPIVEEADRAGAVQNRDLRIRRADGGMLWVQLSAVSADIEGERVLVCGMHDIHLRKQAEETLRKAREESETLVRARTAELARANAALRALLDAIPDIMIRLDGEGRCLDFRPPLGSDKEIPPTEIIGKGIEDLMPREMAVRILATVRESLRTGKVQEVEYELPRQDRTCRYEARVAVCGDNEALAIVRDITERKKAEEQLRRSREELEHRVQERTSQLARTNMELMAEINERRLAQEALALRLRYEEALAAFSQELLEGGDPAEAVRSALMHLLKASGTTHIYVFENFQDPGRGLCMRLASAASAPGAAEELGYGPGAMIAYSEGLDRWAGELARNRPIQGTVDTFPEGERRILEEAGILSMVVLPLRTEEKWSGLVGFCDSRERREWTPEDLRSLRLASEVLGIYFQRQRTYEALDAANRSLRETSSRLTQSEKMASLGMLVAGIAHEINTPLGAIHSMHGTSRLALEKLKAALTEDGAKALDTLPARIRRPLAALDEADRILESGTQRVIGIVKRLRSFARLDEAELKRADLREGMNDTLALIHHELKRRITVVKEYGDIPSIPCYPNQLNQVFLNLLVNAIQAIKGQGVIRISIASVDGEVRVAISDTGHGIPPENLRRIFDPGFTTKGVGVGTGLGLSICYQIVADHRGEIRVESEAGKGSTFTVALPIETAVPEGVSGP
jgi:PAS domain S-box-containing protein